MPFLFLLRAQNLPVLAKCIENKQGFEIESEQINAVLFVQAKRILGTAHRSIVVWKTQTP